MQDTYVTGVSGLWPAEIMSELGNGEIKVLTYGDRMQWVVSADSVQPATEELVKEAKVRGRLSAITAAPCLDF